MTITTNQGAPIVVEPGPGQRAVRGGEPEPTWPSKQFYDNTNCHEITAEGALRCGDPSGTGQGGPTYTFYNENAAGRPDAGAQRVGRGRRRQPPLYPKGTVALIGNPPGTNGSQFLIFFKDFTPADPQYPIVGTVTGGLDTVAKIGKIADRGQRRRRQGQAQERRSPIQSLTVGEPGRRAPAPPRRPPPSAQPVLSSPDHDRAAPLTAPRHSRRNTVSSIKDRQRAAARARLEKEMAERAAAARKRRQRQADHRRRPSRSSSSPAPSGWSTASATTTTRSDRPRPAPGRPAPWPARGSRPTPAAASKIKDVGTPPTERRRTSARRR